MKHEFKPGDMAMITGALTEGGEQNIGKTVELLQIVKCGEKLKADGVLYHAVSGDCWIVAGDELVSRCNDGAGREWFEVKPRCFPLERFLMPLRGDENPDAQLATSAPRQAVTA